MQKHKRVPFSRQEQRPLAVSAEKYFGVCVCAFCYPVWGFPYEKHGQPGFVCDFEQSPGCHPPESFPRSPSQFWLCLCEAFPLFGCFQAENHLDTSPFFFLDPPLFQAQCPSISFETDGGTTERPALLSGGSDVWRSARSVATRGSGSAPFGTETRGPCRSWGPPSGWWRLR